MDTCARAVGVEADKLVRACGSHGRDFGGPARPLIQRLAPYIHRWDESTVFGMSKLRNHIGFEPEYTFESAVEQTYEWFTSHGLDKQREYDFSSEDELIARLS